MEIILLMLSKLKLDFSGINAIKGVSPAYNKPTQEEHVKASEACPIILCISRKRYIKFSIA